MLWHMTQFIQARYFTKGPRTEPITQIVIHTMESQEKPDTAERVAKWFAGPTSPKSSIHWCVDNNSEVQCLLDRDIAWHAGNYTVNARSLGIELAGTAKQTGEQWHDKYSQAELKRAAKIVAAWCHKYDIPVRHLSEAQVKKNIKGICGHIDITRAMDVAGGHTDPGENFPWIDFLQMVVAARAKIN